MRLEEKTATIYGEIDSNFSFIFWPIVLPIMLISLVILYIIAPICKGIKKFMISIIEFIVTKRDLEGDL